MYLITSKDLLYLDNQALLDKDGVAWYKAILHSCGHAKVGVTVTWYSTVPLSRGITWRYDHGQTNTDIRKAKHALEILKVYDSKIVKDNIALLEDAFLNLNNAQTVPLTEEEMTYYIQEKNQRLDGRISVHHGHNECR